MSIPLSSNFDLSAQLPLDERIIQPDIAARDAIADVQRYEGLEVYVVDADGAGTPKRYQLQNGIDNADWVELLLSNPMTDIGDMIYGDIGGVPTRLAGNVTGVRKVLMQFGDGTDALPPTWEVPELNGNLTYMFADTNSDISGYKCNPCAHGSICY